MIVTINPITVNDVTTDKAVVNMAIGDNSVAMSLFPAVEIDGVWTKLNDAPVLPVVGMSDELSIQTMLENCLAHIQKLVSDRGI